MRRMFYLLLMFPFGLSAQMLEVRNYGASEAEKIVQAKAVTLVRSAGTEVSLAFYRLGADLFLELNGSGWALATIDVNNALMLTLADGSDIKVTSIGLQSYAVEDEVPTYHHQYNLSLAALALLSRHEIVSIRRYMFTEFADLSIPAASAHKLKAVSADFQAAVSKPVFAKASPAPAASKTVYSIAAADMARYVGKTVSFCEQVFITRYYQSPQTRATILDFQSNRNGPQGRAIIWQQDKAQFGDLPNAFFTHKKVCVQGEVYLYDNTPYIQISNRNQLQVLSPLTTDEAAFFVADSVTISGVIESAAPSTSDSAWAITLRSPLAKTSVTLLLPSGATELATATLQQHYLHKVVEVSGKLARVNNQLQLVLTDLTKLVLQEDKTKPGFAF